MNKNDLIIISLIKLNSYLFHFICFFFLANITRIIKKYIITKTVDSIIPKPSQNPIILRTLILEKYMQIEKNEMKKDRFNNLNEKSIKKLSSNKA